MSLFAFILSVLGVCLAFGLVLWAYAYWHQNAALDAELTRALKDASNER